jgi:hypothetical protein
MIKHTDPQAPSGFRYELTVDEMNDGYVAFLTGPIEGTLSLPDNSAAYDVTPGAIAVKAEHVEPLALAILREHHANGRFLDAEEPSLADVEDVAP